MGPNISANDYHLGIIRGTLTRNLGALIPELQDEISLTFQDHIPPVHGRLSIVRRFFVTLYLSPAEWTKVKVLATAMKIISRISNRMIVGAPTCEVTQDPSAPPLTFFMQVGIPILWLSISSSPLM